MQFMFSTGALALYAEAPDGSTVLCPTSQQEKQFVKTGSCTNIHSSLRKTRNSDGNSDNDSRSEQ